MKNACSGYRQGSGLCAHGFLQTAACYPQPCFACGRHSSQQVPWCEREEFPPHLASIMLDDGGKPTPLALRNGGKS